MIKIIVGYREDQYFSIPDEEAHKAYFAFSNPEARVIFSNGVALIGKNIQGIEPDWHGIMGWNPTHQLDSDDWNEIKGKNLDTKIRNLLSDAKKISDLAEENPKLLSMELKEAINETKLLSKGSDISSEIKKLSDKFKINK